MKGEPERWRKYGCGGCVTSGKFEHRDPGQAIVSYPSHLYASENYDLIRTGGITASGPCITNPITGTGSSSICSFFSSTYI